MFNVLSYLRSLSFGGLVGSGIAGYLYLRYPHWFKDNVTFEYFVIFGGLLGASMHGFIGALIRLLLFPVARFVDYYSGLIQLHWLDRKNIIDKRTAQEIIVETTREYFLKSNEKSNSKSLRHH